MGSETTYFSDAQAPRSNNRQRSEQKGNSAVVSESVGALQFGQLYFIAESEFYHRQRGNAAKKICDFGRPELAGSGIS